MTDIVERLRKPFGTRPSVLCNEAADEIERLRAALSEETACARQIDDALAKAEAEIERLRAAVEKLCTGVVSAQAEIELLQERLADERADHEATIAHCDKVMNEGQ